MSPRKSNRCTNSTAANALSAGQSMRGDPLTQCVDHRREIFQLALGKIGVVERGEHFEKTLPIGVAGAEQPLKRRSAGVVGAVAHQGGVVDLEPSLELLLERGEERG